MNDFTMIGSHLCPNTLYAIMKCKEAGLSFAFRDISASLTDLRELLALRDKEPCFAALVKEGKIGIPCFILPDGAVTLDLQKVLNGTAQAGDRVGTRVG